MEANKLVRAIAGLAAMMKVAIKASIDTGVATLAAVSPEDTDELIRVDARSLTELIEDRIKKNTAIVEDLRSRGLTSIEVLSEAIEKDLEKEFKAYESLFKEGALDCVFFTVREDYANAHFSFYISKARKVCFGFSYLNCGPRGKNVRASFYRRIRKFSNYELVKMGITSDGSITLGGKRAICELHEIAHVVGRLMQIPAVHAALFD